VVLTFVGVAEAVLVGVAEAVLVGVAEAVFVGVAAVAVALETEGAAEGDGSVLGGVAEVLLGLGVLLEVGVEVGVGSDRVGVGVGVGVGDGLGDAGSCSGSHSWPVPLAATVAADAAEAVFARLDGAADAAIETPVAVVTSTPPVTKLTVADRTYAKRMKALPVLLVATAERLFSMEWPHQARCVRLVQYVTIGQ
jgi:hypothetical protein